MLLDLTFSKQKFDTLILHKQTPNTPYI